jgi:excisionase family DNA binding protein
MSPKLSYRIDEAMAATGLGKTVIYRLIEAGRLKSVKVGACRLITANSLRELVETGSSEAA